MAVNGTVLSNLDGIVFNKGFLYGSRAGVGNDGVAFGALQSVELSHQSQFVELDGPESLSPLGVGQKGETVGFNWEAGVLDPEQFTLLMGGSMSYNGGTGATTYTKTINQEANAFDVHFKSAAASPDLEVYLYNCLCADWNIRADNRGFFLGRGQARAYGQSTANGGKLWDIIKPGNSSNAS